MPADPSSKGFYRDLPGFSDFTEIAQLDRFRPAPDDWRLILSDVVDSTAAIEQGRYRDVNALGTCSIVAVLRAVGDLELPYVFGGDGAVVLIPPQGEAPARKALGLLSATAERIFGLNLRLGMVRVSELRRAGAELLVARFRLSDQVSLAMLAGGGVDLAERWIKGSEGGRFAVLPGSSSERGLPDFLHGFQCRWEPIPSRWGEMVSVLVVPRGPSLQERHEVLEQVIRFIGALDPQDKGRPTANRPLKMETAAGRLKVEARLLGKSAGWGAVRNRFTQPLLRSGWKGYLEALVNHTDYRKFDDTLRMVLDLPRDSRRSLEAFLGGLYREGRLFFGLAQSSAAVMTCFISRYEGEHVHFVDGADGGYALAAKAMKAQRAARKKEEGPGH